MWRWQVLCSALVLLAAMACGSADSPADKPGDLRAVRSMTVDYTGDTLVARVRTEVLADRSRILLNYAWVEGAAFEVVLVASLRDGKPVATGLWINNSEEFTGRIDRDAIDVDWDEDTRTVTFTFIDPKRCDPDPSRTFRCLRRDAKVYAWGLGLDENVNGADATIPDYAVSKHVTRRS